MKTLLQGISALTILFASFTYAAPGGVISGTVKGPDGSVYKGAFVRAQSTKTKITVNVLSDRNGAYRIQNLEAGEYQVTAVAVGFKSDPRSQRESRCGPSRVSWISLCRKEWSGGPTFPFTKGKSSCPKARANSCCFTGA